MKCFSYLFTPFALLSNENENENEADGADVSLNAKVMQLTAKLHQLEALASRDKKTHTRNPATPKSNGSATATATRCGDCECGNASGPATARGSIDGTVKDARIQIRTRI
jgi:hypothetical protein